MGGKGCFGGQDGVVMLFSRFIMTRFGYCFLLADVSTRFFILPELSVVYCCWTPFLLLFTGFFEGTEAEIDFPEEVSWLAWFTLLGMAYYVPIMLRIVIILERK